MSDEDELSSGGLDETAEMAKEMERYGGKASLKDNVSKMGKFSKAEDNMILEHITEFCSERGITPDELVPEMRNEEAASAHMKRAMIQFLNQLKTIIPERKRSTLYRRSLRLIAGGLRGDEWSEEEKRQILQMHAKHGPKWAMIANALGRYADDVRDAYRRLRPRRRRGRFSPEEDEQLVKLIMKHVNVTDPGKLWTQRVYRIPWDTINKEMGEDRLPSDLERHYHALSRKMLAQKNFLSSDSSTRDDFRLVKHLYDMGYEDPSEFYWRDIEVELQLPFNCNQRFHDLMKTVPTMSFGDAVEYHKARLEKEVEQLDDWEANLAEAEETDVGDEETEASSDEVDNKQADVTDEEEQEVVQHTKQAKRKTADHTSPKKSKKQEGHKKHKAEQERRSIAASEPESEREMTANPIKTSKKQKLADHTSAPEERGDVQTPEKKKKKKKKDRNQHVVETEEPARSTSHVRIKLEKGNPTTDSEVEHQTHKRKMIGQDDDATAEHNGEKKKKKKKKSRDRDNIEAPALDSEEQPKQEKTKKKKVKKEKLKREAGDSA